MELEEAEDHQSLYYLEKKTEEQTMGKLLHGKSIHIFCSIFLGESKKKKKNKWSQQNSQDSIKFQTGQQ